MNEEKKERVEYIKEKLKASEAIVLTDYRGLSVSEMEKLRGDLRGAQSEYKVIKNTLAKRAAAEAGMEDLSELLNGPVAMAFGDDPVSLARILKNISREYKELQITGGVAEGRILNAEEMGRLADLPSREVLIAMMLGALQSPISGLANVLSGPVRNLVYALNAVKEQKSQ